MFCTLWAQPARFISSAKHSLLLGSCWYVDGGKASSTAQQSAPDDNSKASSPSDVKGGQGILTFVYTADPDGKSGGTVFDIQQETGETQQ